MINDDETIKDHRRTTDGMGRSVKELRTTTEVRYRFDPVPVDGYGRSSARKRTQRFVATGVIATVDPDGLTIRWTGTKNGNPIADWFSSKDPALAGIRREAASIVRAAHAAAVQARSGSL